MRWLLIGDDGQHDEEIYGDFAAEHPEQCGGGRDPAAVPGEAVLAGGRSKGTERDDEPSVSWFYARCGPGRATRRRRVPPAVAAVARH